MRALLALALCLPPEISADDFLRPLWVQPVGAVKMDNGDHVQGYMIQYVSGKRAVWADGRLLAVFIPEPDERPWYDAAQWDGKTMRADVPTGCRWQRWTRERS